MKRKEKERKVGIVVFAFGAPRNLESNKILGKIALEKAKELDATIFTQYDIPLDEDYDVVRPNETMNCPPTTYELAFKALEWAKQQKIKEVWIVAAPPHQTRCCRDIGFIAEQTRQNDIEFNLCEETNHKKFKNYWFCKNSKQKHTASPWKWWSRELRMLLIPIFFYKRLTRS